MSAEVPAHMDAAQHACRTICLAVDTPCCMGRQTAGWWKSHLTWVHLEALRSGIAEHVGGLAGDARVDAAAKEFVHQHGDLNAQLPRGHQDYALWALHRAFLSAVLPTHPLQPICAICAKVVNMPQCIDLVRKPPSEIT